MAAAVATVPVSVRLRQAFSPGLSLGPSSPFPKQVSLRTPNDVLLQPRAAPAPPPPVYPLSPQIDGQALRKSRQRSCRKWLIPLVWLFANGLVCRAQSPAW